MPEPYRHEYCNFVVKQVLKSISASLPLLLFIQIVLASLNSVSFYIILNPFVTLDFFESLLKFLFEIALKLYISLREIDIVTILSVPNGERDTCFSIYLDPL